MKFWVIGIIFGLVPLLCLSADWPVPQSIKCNSFGTFHCKNAGRFEDPFDSTCTKYVLCSEIEEETVEVRLTCPEDTFYDPVNEVCSTDYKCICDNDNDTAISTSTTPIASAYPVECDICSQCITATYTKNTFSSKENTPATEKLTLSTKESIIDSSQLTSSASSFADGSLTTNNSVEYCSAGGIFTCTQTGRFGNPNDSSCNSYFYCYEFSDGKLGQYKYSCSIGMFNPKKESCDPSYVCPCAVASTTETSIPQTPVTNGSTDSGMSPVMTKSTTEPTTATSAYCSIGRNFTCTQTGRFANLNDPSCNSYFYCYVHSDGKVDENVITCSIGLFNPEKGRCDRSYVCPCSTVNTTEAAFTSSSTELPLTTVNQSASFPYTPTTNGSADGEISPSVITNSTTRPTAGTPAFCSTGRNFTCTQTGRFVNPNDPSCNSYFYCYVHSNGKVDQNVTSCSIGLFNPEKGRCDRSYVCPCSVANTTEAALTSSSTELPLTTVNQSSSSPHTPVTNGSADSEISPSVITNFTTRTTAATPAYCSSGINFTCTETGRFANPNDRSCNSYFYCYVHSGGKIGQYVTSCSIGLFNPEKGSCDHSYVCPCSVANTTDAALTSLSTELPLTTVNQSASFPHTPTTNGSADSEITPSVITNFTTRPTAATPAYCSSGINFTCTETGRFANPNDPSCNSYFYCYVHSGGKIGQYVTSCSIGLFNPEKGSCDHSYVCPCSVANTTDAALTSLSTELPLTTFNQSESFPQTPTTNGSADSEITPSVITNVTTRPTAATPAYCSSGINFTCTQTGRFANPNDLSCNSYFYCYVHSGKIGQYVTSCSIGLFNPEKGSCDHSYVCPCLVANTTETAFTSSSTELPFSTDNQSSSFPHTPATNGSADSEITPSAITKSTTKPTAATPAYCSIGGNFTCTRTGRFANPNDPSCNSYFYCYVNWKGKICQYNYSCSLGLFNPEKRRCDPSYICPCSVSITTESEANHSLSSSPPTVSTASPSISTDSTTELVTTTPASEPCSTNQSFTCTVTGRFANPNDKTCKSYFYCYVWSNGKVRQYSYSCAVGLFNPEKQSCDLKYVCPCATS